MNSRVLVVDDDLEFASYLATVLSSEFQVSVDKATASGALLLLESQCYCLIISDLYMGGKDGVEFIGEVRSREQKKQSSKRIPIIVVTQSMELEHIKRAFEVGANAYVIKPFDTDDLVAEMCKVSELLGKLRDPWPRLFSSTPKQM